MQKEVFEIKKKMIPARNLELLNNRLNSAVCHMWVAKTIFLPM